MFDSLAGLGRTVELQSGLMLEPPPHRPALSLSPAPPPAHHRWGLGPPAGLGGDPRTAMGHRRRHGAWGSPRALGGEGARTAMGHRGPPPWSLGP